MNKISIRLFDAKEVRAVWDDDAAEWWFSVIDIVGLLSQSKDARNYWYVLKSRLKKAGNELLTNCKGFKLMAPDDEGGLLWNDPALGIKWPHTKDIILSEKDKRNPGLDRCFKYP